MKTISFTLNGKPTHLKVDETRTLLWVLRDELGLTGTKYGCGMALCGACTVVVNNQATRACVTSMEDVAGKNVTTIEGLAKGDQLHPVQEAFAKHLAFQCGYCTPGLIMGAYALLSKNPGATRDTISNRLNGHICRCGAHVRVLDACEEAGAAMKGGVR